MDDQFLTRKFDFTFLYDFFIIKFVLGRVKNNHQEIKINSFDLKCSIKKHNKSNASLKKLQKIKAKRFGLT